MTITVRETSPGTFERLTGNPTLESLDGRVKAPLRTILAPSWTDQDRAAFGVFVVEPAEIPDGKRAVGTPTYEKRNGVVVDVRTVEDIPERAPDTRTPVEKVDDMLARFGVTIEELRAVLRDGDKQ